VQAELGERAQSVEICGRLECWGIEVGEEGMNEGKLGEMLRGGGELVVDWLVEVEARECRGKSASQLVNSYALLIS